MSAQEVGDVIATAEDLELALTEGPLVVGWWLQCVHAGDPWLCVCDQDGEWWALRPLSEDDPPEWKGPGVYVPLDEALLPLTIVATSDSLPRPERVVKAEALREAADWVANSLMSDPTAIDALEVIARDLLAEADRIEAGESR